MKITIILPVYGRSELLGEALESVKNQESEHWRLVIADDGSDTATIDLIEAWIEENKDRDIEWHKREQNRGLFANLNQAIRDAKTKWVLLLCSDDLLMRNATKELQELQQQWPGARLILSTYNSINADGSARTNTSAWYHNKVSKVTALLPPDRFIPSLLEWGSLNGNLTGMAFTRRLWLEAGAFREDWRHAADWEWLLRASNNESVLLSRKPIAYVRTHPAQLSNSNRRSGHELEEVSEVVRSLVAHPLLANEPRRIQWAAHVMQFQLWNMIKQLPDQGLKQLVDDLAKIHASAGLRATCLALLRFAPQRLRGWIQHDDSDANPLAK